MYYLPVGPTSSREATGRLGLFSPQRARMRAEATQSTASSWPIRRCFRAEDCGETKGTPTLVNEGRSDTVNRIVLADQALL